MRWLLLACVLVACGDNQHGEGVPLARGRDLVVVAHQDDDLLFMSPDLVERIEAGTGLTNVYVTAGNATHGPEAANPRYAGLMAAYGEAAQDHDWFCGWIEIAGHTAQHCRLERENVSLVFLAYPDGGIPGNLPHSLLSLWEGTTPSATTIADRVTTYDREGLIQTVAEIIREVRPSTIHTLDLPASHGRDHSDHLIVGALTAMAIARTHGDPELIAYRGYDNTTDPANKTPAIYAKVQNMLSYYEGCATKCDVDCGQSCKNIDHAHLVWLGGRYAIGFRRTGTGKLQFGDQCLVGATLGACATAPVWTLHHGHLHSDAGCLALVGDALGIASCTDDPEQRFFYDDEGHLWSGVAPAFAPMLEQKHMRCLFPADDGTTLTSTACGGPDAPTWQWAPVLATTSRAQLGFPETGREIRIGDVTGDGLGDLCAISGGNLICAAGVGDGTFGVGTVITALAIEPDSLTLGDLDGDGIADACGRDDGGILCARSTDLFVADRYTPDFGSGHACANTPQSLRITDANGDGIADVCGLADAGVVCSPGGSSFNQTIRSSWPSLTDPLLPADMDGDHQADWCTLTESGPACGLASEAAVTTDGGSWAYSLMGVADMPPADPAIVDIADIDGDGNGDLCGLYDPMTISCARSNGHGFGPHNSVAQLPSPATALWLGDLDGDGRADACADLGDAIACARL